MQKTIISDTSCLILLEKIGELELLHNVFGEIDSVKPLLKKIKQTDFHFSVEIEKKILAKIGEI